MYRPLKWLFLSLSVVLWLNWVYAADSSGVRPKGESSPSTTAQRAPSIQVAETIHDFGQVFEGAEVIHDFRVKNSGKAVLEIAEVRPG